MKERQQGLTYALFRRTPTELFGRIGHLLIIAALMVSTAMKMRRFGMVAAKVFDIQYGIVGLLLFGVVVTICFLLIERKQFGAFARFVILYVAFIPPLTLSYLRKLLEMDYLFDVYGGLEGSKWMARLGFWTSDLVGLFIVLVPMCILMLAAIHPRSYPRWYWVLIGLCFLFAGLDLLYWNFANLSRYLISLFLVCIIADSWEQIRGAASLEPAVMVSWAEILLFTALWLKGVVELL